MVRLSRFAFLVALLAQGCAGSTAERRPDAPPEPAPPPEDATSTEPERAASTPAPAAPAAADAAPHEGAPPPLPARVDAGEISRQALQQVLSGGVARFLQRVQTERHLERGRFVGWRLLSTYANDDDGADAGVLAPGDTVMRVNGQSIERPEQFKNVWDSMATSSELVLEVRRGEQQSTVRYTIVDR